MQRNWLRCGLWVALCFLLTSAIYLAWVYRLVALLGASAADWLSMVAGYTLQGVGAALVGLLLRKRPGRALDRPFALTMALLALFGVPALTSGSAAVAVACGLVMNLLCGVTAGFYLYAVAARVEAPRRGLAFGGGYAAATVALGLVALVGDGWALRGPFAPYWCAVLAALAAYLAKRLALLDAPGAPAAQAPKSVAPGLVALACGVVALTSLVKNLGFGFPSADIEAGFRPEFSRLFYAVGLTLAGFISDKSRRNGAACMLAALVIPFVMLTVSGEPVSSALCWGLDYLFYGFFSVFRAVLLMDLAADGDAWALAPLGLALGRLGDAGGTALCLWTAGNPIAVVALAAGLFAVAVLALYRLDRALYVPAAPPSEREVFEAFSLRHDLSGREREVLRLLLDERSNGEIAEALFVSESTVKYHVHNLLKKTGCKSRGELLKKYNAALFPRMGNELVISQ